jgi:cyanophycinase
MPDRFALLGSGEFEPWSLEVERRLLEAASGDGSVLVLPTASAPEGEDVFDRWAAMGLEHYREAGILARSLPLKTPADANEPDIVAPLRTASMVFFSGGNPAYLAGVLAGSRFWERLLEELRRGLGYAGCSAGISCLGDVAPDSSVGDLAAPARWKRGLRLFPGVTLAPHWDAVDRFFPGLQSAIEASIPPGSRLLAVDEHTAVVGDGAGWSVIGSGGATLVENGRRAVFSAGATFHADLGPAPGGLAGGSPREQPLDLSAT